MEDQEAIQMALSWPAVVAFALIVASAAPTGAGHEQQARPDRFTTIVFPQGLAYNGAYVSGKCNAYVNVEIKSVELTVCSFFAK